MTKFRGADWSTERVERVRARLGEGVSQSTIAAELGMTKGQISGFAWRDGINRRRKKPAQLLLPAPPKILALPAPAPLPPEPPLSIELKMRPETWFGRRAPKVLCGYGSSHPDPLPRGTFYVSSNSLPKVRCWCGYDWIAKNVTHNVVNHACQNYTVDCPHCNSYLICCGFNELRGKSVA